MTSRLRSRSIAASLSAIAAMAVAVPSASAGHGDAGAVARAIRCVDGRHAALVTNAVRRGVPIDARDAARWCG
jgi:hypothetical protein